MLFPESIFLFFFYFTEHTQVTPGLPMLQSFFGYNIYTIIFTSSVFTYNKFPYFPLNNGCLVYFILRTNTFYKVLDIVHTLGYFSQLIPKLGTKII